MLNTIILIGRLTRDPELRYTSSGTAVTNFGIAVNRFKKEGAEQTADFFNITCWNRLAEIVAEYQHKGNLVAVQGRLQSRTVDKDGQKRTYVEVVADTVKFLDKKGENQQDKQEQGYRKDERQGMQYESQKPMQFGDEPEDDLPFDC